MCNKKIQNRIKYYLLAVVVGVLLFGICKWNSASTVADALGLTEYASEGIEKIVILPRPGSGDEPVTITAQETITTMLDWFASVKVTEGSSMTYGLAYSVFFYAPNKDALCIDMSSEKNLGVAGKGEYNLLLGGYGKFMRSLLNC